MKSWGYLKGWTFLETGCSNWCFLAQPLEFPKDETMALVENQHEELAPHNSPKW